MRAARRGAAELSQINEDRMGGFGFLQIVKGKRDGIPANSVKNRDFQKKEGF
jgi:hypothetical protein